MKRALLLLIFFISAASSIFSQTLLHYWNFNVTSSEAAHTTPAYTIGGASLNFLAGATSANDYLNGTGQNFNVQNLNARNGDAPGNHLRINNPPGSSITLSIPSTGFRDVMLKYATRRSNTGATIQEVRYSTDGSNFILLTSVQPNNGDPTLQSFDFSGIPAADNNPDFKVRITILQGTGSDAGNNRFDNITLDGTPAGDDVLAPTVVFNPADNASGIAVNSVPTLTFNEDIRGVDNAPLSNATVDNLVIFKTNDAAGTDVPFDATINGRVISLTPTTALSNNQKYYLALKANTVEDLSDNAITGLQSVVFTTVPLQTVFAPGDLLLVAYQMNAVPNSDRIAFVTLVNILPGTSLTFTDAKYTSLTPALCPGGLVWTAPAAGVVAGTVITINNDAATADIGSVTGSGFGLSANGDQVIVYSGSNDDPKFVTALSSNAWVGENTVCNGSVSLLPAGLTDGASSINLGSAPGNTAGNTVNAFYSGITSGTVAQLKTAITNPANWTGSGTGTPAQTWPTWNFFGPPVVTETRISFNAATLSVDESAGTVDVIITITNPSVSSVDLKVLAKPASTADSSDYTFASTTLRFNGTSPSTQTISIPVNDDAAVEQDEYFVLVFENAIGLTSGTNKTATIFIRDNDRKAPVPTKTIQLEYLGSYDPSGSSNASSEIVVHDSASKRLFIISALQDRLDIADFSNADSIKPFKTIDMTPYGGITSVAVRNGIVAVSSPNANEQLNGSVVFFNTDGIYQKQVTVGALPDMITFTPDGKFLMTANEGQPNDSYTVDPEGSVSMIDMSGGIGSVSQSSVTTLDFTAFNAKTAELLAAGVRKGFPGSTLSQDLEPEYITFSADSKTAWVILQEANAFAVIDIASRQITDIWSLGKKDHSLPGNGFDASDSGPVHIANWPVKGLYMPDGIASYNAGGTTFIVGANEGDDREYSAFNERVRVNAATYLLDSAKFPNASILKQDFNLGRLRVTRASGDTDGDGDFDEIHLIGGRSFSIWNAATKSVVYDSKDDFEQYISKTPKYAPIFNADHESNTPKARSTSKGPEPEGLALAQIAGKQYAFIGLERQGGVMVYDITDPNAVKFVDYNNPRNLASYGGDNGPEGITYISEKNSPDGRPYIIVANEISGTLSIYRVTGEVNGKPKVSVVSPVNGATVAAGKPVTLRADASVVNGTISRVEFYNNGVRFLTDSVAPYQYSDAGVEAGLYVLTAKAFDSEGNSAVSDTVRITVTACTPDGYISAEGYANIPGTQVTDLLSSASYPNNPTVAAQLAGFSYGDNLAENYGARVRGYICAPQTGYYVFSISADDQAGLWLSTDDNPANKVLIASVQTPVAPGSFDVYPSQHSAAIRLIKGGRYYVETLHKENVGVDHMSVAWTIPDGSTQTPISGNHLSPFTPVTATTVNASGVIVPKLLSFEKEMQNVSTLPGLKVIATPNPTTSHFTVTIRSNRSQAISIRVTDVLGRVVELRPGVAANSIITFGSDYKAGIYFVEVKQGTKTERIKLLKH